MHANENQTTKRSLHYGRNRKVTLNKQQIGPKQPSIVANAFSERYWMQYMRSLDGSCRREVGIHLRPGCEPARWLSGVRGTLVLTASVSLAVKVCKNCQASHSRDGERREAERGELPTPCMPNSIINIEDCSSDQLLDRWCCLLSTVRNGRMFNDARIYSH